MKQQDSEMPGENLGSHTLSFSVNGEKFEHHRQYISGAEIRKTGNVPDSEHIYLEVKEPWEDEPVPDEKEIDLARPGQEHFYSHPKEVKIFVEGKPHPWDKPKISFEEVIILAYGKYIDKPTMTYTVAYEDGPKQNPEDSLYKEQKVFVKNKMIFHATAADKS